MILALVLLLFLFVAFGFAIIPLMRSGKNWDDAHTHPPRKH